MSYIPVPDGNYRKLSPPARRSIAVLERFRDSGETVWEVNTLWASRIADLTVVRQIEALRELADAEIIALRWVDDCGLFALVSLPHHAADLDRCAANYHQPAATGKECAA